MIILAFDSTAKAASVAITEDEKLLALYTIDNGLTQSELLLPMAENILSSLKLSFVNLREHLNNGKMAIGNSEHQRGLAGIILFAYIEPNIYQVIAAIGLAIACCNMQGGVAGIISLVEGGLLHGIFFFNGLDVVRCCLCHSF